METLFHNTIMNQQLQTTVIMLVINLISSEILNSEVDCYNKKLNKNGVCVGLKFCETALNMLEKYQLPQICRYEEGYPIVCCPLEERKITDRRKIYSSVSERKCNEYQEMYNKINVITVQNNIIGGKNAKLGEYPHMASLGYGAYPDILWLCGGSLISERFILTAAHCVRNREFGEVKYAQLGDVKLHSFDSKKYTITKRYIHPDHKFPKTYHDIALLQLDRNAEMSIYIRPACLLTNQDGNVFKRYSLTATGWGVVSRNGPQSEVLQKVNLEFFDNYHCSQMYKPSRKMRVGLRSDIQICYGSRWDSKDSCQGDSGGPLQFYDYDAYSYKIAGVVSVGNGCGVPGTSGIYTKVSHYSSWIESIVWP